MVSCGEEPNIKMARFFSSRLFTEKVGRCRSFCRFFTWAVDCCLWAWRVHVGVSVHICTWYQIPGTCYWCRGQEKKRRETYESVFRFLFSSATETPTKKSQFLVWRNREKPTEKNDFRFSIHHTGKHTEGLLCTRVPVKMLGDGTFTP